MMVLLLSMYRLVEGVEYTEESHAASLTAIRIVIWDKVFKNGPNNKAVFQKFYLVHS